MSTLGGSRGERNAKPKFAALDINRLYKNSRGESVDTSTQKNQAPRIHGMQSLGKVPSARRPPANLPSLKAEVKSPGNIIKIGQDGANQSVVSGTSGLNSASASINSNHISSTANNNYQSSDRHSSLTHSHSSHHSSTLNNSSSVTWSSVTTGQDGVGGSSLPPLYQSPQFQHEFPSLDGTTPGSGSHKPPNQKDAQQSISNISDGSGGSGNGNANDMSQVSLRPQTDAASWNQQSGKGGADTGHGKQQGPDHQQVVPPPMRALMPSFVYRGNMGPDSNSGARSLTPPNQNGNFSANIGRKDYRSNSPNAAMMYRSGVQKRPPSLNTPPPNRGGSRDRDTGYVEAEVAIVQRPIIKEEELERMNAILKDDGWTQKDEIDYNQKLAFSDDESPDNTPAIERERPNFSKSSDKRGGSTWQPPQSQQQTQTQKPDQDGRDAWQRSRDNEKDRKDRENIEKERNDRNERERDVDSRDNRQMQQNGHRGSGLDATVYERAKQRKELEEKQEFERKQAAAKKLQELEMKLGTKKDGGEPASHEEHRVKEEEFHASQARRPFKDQRDYGRFDKYEREPHRDFQGNQARMSTNQSNKGFFGGHGSQFASNLPPRFLKQQQQQQAASGQVGSSQGSGGNANNNMRSITANQMSSQNYHGGASESREKSNVPFAQQYDPRYIHSQNYKQQQTQMRRDSYNRPSQGYGRSRNDHGDTEDDQRFSRGNRDRDYEQGGRGGGQLSRSISDSSQRKTSVSSNDDQKFGDPQRPDSRDFGSWAEESETETRRQRNVSMSSNQSRNDDEVQVKILQRPQTKSISECSTKNEKILESEEKAEEHDECTKPTETFVPTQILRRSESPKFWSDSTGQAEDNADMLNEAVPASTESSQLVADSKSNEVDSINQGESLKEIDSLNEGQTNKDKAEDSFGKTQREQKRPSPRSGGVNVGHGGRQDPRGPPNRGYNNSYRGGSGGGVNSWGRRGGNMRSGGGRHYNDWSESENSEDVGDDDYHRRSNRSPKPIRKDARDGRDQRNQGHVQPSKDGFAPRGEPSRRGRGGAMTGSSSSYRRGGQASHSGHRRLDSYNSSSTKYLSEDDKDKKDSQATDESTTDDKAKQNALTAALKKSELDDKNKPKALSGHSASPPKRDDKKNSPPKNYAASNYQHARKESTSSSKNDESRKDDIDRDGERRKSASKEKDMLASSMGQQQQQSGGQIRNISSANNPSNMNAKKDDRGGQKAAVTKPPPGLGFKSNSNLTQVPQNSQQTKEQALQKSKSSTDTRQNAPNVSKNNAPSRMNKQWEGNRRREEGNASWEKSSQDKADVGVDNQSSAGNQSENKVILDGSTAPVNTIIFENTNYKTSVQRQISSQPSDAGQGGNHSTKNADESYNSKSLPQSNNNTQADAQHQQMPAGHHTTEAITTALSQMSFNKQQPEAAEYEKDMKMGFTFDSEFTLSEEKNASPAVPNTVNVATSKAVMCHPRASVVMQQPGQNTISPSTADLNMKIASVKKVWESAPPMQTVLEHGNMPVNEAEAHMNATYVQNQPHLQHFAVAAAAAAQGGNIHIQHALSSSGPQSYANTFDPSMEQHYVQKDATVVGVVGNANPNEQDVQVGYSPSPQHVGPTQQVGHQSGGPQNMGGKHPSEAGNVCKQKLGQQIHQQGLGLSPPPNMQHQQQGHAQMHQAAAPQTFYQPSQFTGIPTIPSPPTVLFNSPGMPSQGGLYPFQLEPGRSQFSQYPHYGTTGNGPYNAYPMQTPPNMPTAPAPEMYSNLTSQFRMGGAVQSPFNQNQQLNNPNTVLISSSSNSLMSASVKPSSQQIGAIGSKNNAAAVAGQAYGQQYMNLYQQQAPPQLSSNSYYSNSAAGQGAFFGGPSGAATQNYSLQAAAGMFGGHGGPAPSNGPTQQQIAGFNSQFMNTPLLPAAINQFRGGPSQQSAQAYMKNQGQNHMQDSMGRQLKSPLGADVSLNIAKQVQPQQSPPHHKNYAPSWDMNQVMQQQSQQSQQQNLRGGPQNNMNQGGRPGQGPQRYPTPIQRPTNYPQHPQSQQPPQSQRQMRQPHSVQQGGPQMNKHYYGNNNNSGPRGHHVNNQIEQHKSSNVEKDPNNSQPEMTVKEDNSND